MKYVPAPNQKAMIDKIHNYKIAGEKDICICCKCAILSVYGEESAKMIGCVSRLKNLLSVYGLYEEDYSTSKKPSDRFAYFNCTEAYKDLFLRAFSKSKKDRILKI